MGILFWTGGRHGDCVVVRSSGLNARQRLGVAWCWDHHCSDSGFANATIDDIKITPVEYADQVLKVALTKELKRTEWVEVDISKKDDKSQASIQ